MNNNELFSELSRILKSTGDKNNTFYVYNEDKSGLLLYTEADPKDITRLIIERKGDRFIELSKVKQAREEMESKLYKGIPETTGFTWQNLGINMCLEILDKLIESEG